MTEDTRAVTRHPIGAEHQLLRGPSDPNTPPRL